ncbi:disulfide bond formation protein B [Sneathiella sp. HT1-7]|uniref:disulfide bond formation protein B n=1 Tax=Sneathiella sp. HT1-7 TaxID=2887192 RepID=UPI001D1355CD|nr:disulfide bond formation protein B [Sneathiella sp. HT1-7]MCC3304138.1 disulfide bond formation protein B [Sneathiella sp. HT1-7]
MKNALWVALLGSVGALGAAFIAQYVFDLWPCVLCLYQRWPYAAVIVISLAGIALHKRIGAGPFLLLCALGFAVTAAVAGYHVGVEQGWWEGTAECVGDTAKASNLQELKAKIMSTPIVRCDEVAWSLFGISMAGYNVIAGVILTVFSLFAALSSFKSK